MNRTVSILLWLAMVAGAGAAEPVVIQSRSGQFMTRGPSLVRPANVAAPAVETGFVLLDPSLLAVSCEEIKRTLLKTLDIPDRWRHRIWLTIEHNRTAGDQEIIVEAVRYRDGWRYRLMVPASVERRRLVRTLIHVLLLEIVQRNATQPVTDLPPWLGDGLMEMLLTHHPMSLTLSPYSHVAGDQYRRDPLFHVRRLLQQSAPLSLEELNWPDGDQRFGGGQERYLACSHLLVHEMLKVPGGTAAVQGMLANLHDHLNWQTAFLKSSPFPSMLELDKWWSLIVVQMTGRDLLFTWSFEETWTRLEEVLHTPVQIRVRSSDLPMSSKATLQSVLQEWDFRRQLPVLRTKVNHLQALRLRASQSLVDSVDSYRRILEQYLAEREPDADARGKTPFLLRPFRRGRVDEVLLIQETVRQLDGLDDQLRTMKQLMRAAEANRTVRAVPAVPVPNP